MESVTTPSMTSIPHFHSSFPFHLPKRSSPSSPSLRLRIRPLSASKRNTDGSEDHFGRSLVDENMIVLRKRIHDMDLAERNYDPPSNWTQWEKRYYTEYGSDICDFVGLIQTLMMNSRPAVAIGFVALVAMSVPTSAVLISLHLMETAKSLCF